MRERERERERADEGERLGRLALTPYVMLVPEV